MNTTTVLGLRIVFAQHRKWRRDPDHWREIRSRTTRGKRTADRPLCGLPDLCSICREARYLFPFPCGTHGTPAGEPCGPCLDQLDWAYLLASPAGDAIAAGDAA